MKNKLLLATGTVIAVSALAATSASAQEAPWAERRVAAPQNALELSVGTAYTQGFGMVTPNRSVPDVAAAGLGFDLGLGYRVSPEFLIGVNGGYQELTAQGAVTAARGMHAGVNADVHFLPTQRVDPWISIGAGYRMLWQLPNTPGPNILDHGFELARVTAGLNIRASRDIAIGPMIGGDVNLFLWEKREGASNTALSSGKLNTFVFAGLQGQFDIGGDRVRGPLPTTLARE